MTVQASSNRECAPTSIPITPSILYYGTPVALVSSLNPDASPNLAPMSSSWALGQNVVLGLGAAGQTVGNIRRQGQCVINLPDTKLWEAVERLAPLTGRDPIPDDKHGTFRFEPRKFEAAQLTPVPSECVEPPRVLECQLQLEAELRNLHRGSSGSFYIAEVEVVRVHADPAIVIDGTSHVDTSRWHPLFYVFRHYFSAGARVGRTFRAEY
jgi:flavin reductase (DIM6/NTAB) family NADH-FMN oxidoreductase RutF